MFAEDPGVGYLTACGRFAEDRGHGQTFASDSEADRMVERLASDLPIFITHAAT